MNPNANKSPDGARPLVVVSAVAAVVVCVAGAIFFLKRGAHPSGQESGSEIQIESAASNTSITSTPADDVTPVLITNEPIRPTTSGRSQLTIKRPAPATPAPQVPARPEPTPMGRYLVNNLVALDKNGVPKTPEQIAAWKQGLTNLVQQGESGLSAIQEYLEKNVDFALDAESAKALGYSSTRAALYDALAQIGGSAAAGVLLNTLQTTADPHDLVSVARTLDQMAPDQYRQQIVDASREVLNSYGVVKGNQTDVAALFQVLDKYGGANAVSDIQNASSNYRYYSAIALSQLPDGAGVPSLVQMVNDNGGGQVKNVAALEALTQAASANTDARSALVQQVKANTISSYGWASLTAILSGDQIQYLDSDSGNSIKIAGNGDVRTYHIAAGNQNFYTAPPTGGMTADQISQQLSLIDELLSATTNPSAIQSLQTARNTLTKRSTQASTTTAGK